MNFQQTAPPVWRPRTLFWGMIFVLVLLAGLTALAITLFAADWLEANLLLAVNLHSPHRADYSADPRGLLLPAMNLGLVGEVVRDNPGSADPRDPLATVVVVLQTPVPTVTPLFTPTPGAPPPATLQPTPSETVPPTATLGPGETALPTLTPTGTATITPTSLSTATRLPSATGLPPTRTLEPRTQTPLPPTATQIPPTRTPVLPSPVPPTRTPPPPTPTPDCGGGGYPAPPGCPTLPPYP